MKKLLSGNEAIALGAYEAGVTVASGYPGTPSTEILENLVNYDGVKCQWSPNEKVAMEVGIGASFAGARVLVTMKHVGVNVAADPLFTFSYTGVKGGFVFVSADDPELHSSQNEQDNRNYARFAKIPVIEPCDSNEAKTFLKKAYEISEKFDTPIMFRTTTRLSHTRTVVEEGEKQTPTVDLGFDRNPKKYVMVPAFGREKHKYIEERLMKIMSYNDTSDLNRIDKLSSPENQEIGIITSGTVYTYVKEIIKDIDVLKLGMIYPFPKELVKNFCKTKKKIFIIEELDGFLEEELLKLRLDVEIIGKSMFPNTGELTPWRIRKYFYNDVVVEETDIDIPPRPPVLCAGCPHRGVYSVLSKKDVIVTGDIGCYTLGVLPPLSSLDTCVCMGAGIGNAVGMVKANPDYENKVIAVIGDSTFMHSGVTGIVDALYNKANITVMILDNRITAMTGHQDHPGTGYTLSKEPTVAVDYKNLALGVGYPESSIDTINPLNLSQTKEIIEKHLNMGKPSIIISKSPCALLNKKGKPVYFRIKDEYKKDCEEVLEIGCPAIEKQNGEVTINKNMCRACSMCVQIAGKEKIVSEKK